MEKSLQMAINFCHIKLSDTFGTKSKSAKFMREKKLKQFQLLLTINYVTKNNILFIYM